MQLRQWKGDNGTHCVEKLTTFYAILGIAILWWKLSSCHIIVDFDGCALWDLTHSSVEDVCIAWRKALRRILWDLPYCTHSNLLAPVSGLTYELFCRSASFIVKSLVCANSVVSFITKNGVYYRMMLSPIGRNVFYCCSFFRAEHICWYKNRLVGDVPFHLKFALKVTHPLWKTPTSTNIC